MYYRYWTILAIIRLYQIGGVGDEVSNDCKIHDYITTVRS